jgi:hypothetical protein
MLFEAYGGETVTKSSVSEWQKRFKQSSHVGVRNEGSAHHFLRYGGYCLLWIHSTWPKAYCVEVLKRLCEAMFTKRPELWSNDWILHYDNALCLAVSGTKIDGWNGTPILFPWFCSEWLSAVSKNKFYLKGTKISGHWGHPKNVTTALKAVPQRFPTVPPSFG